MERKNLNERRVQDVVNTLPESPRALKKYLASLPSPTSKTIRASQEERRALRRVLRTEMRRTPWAERELGLLKRAAGAAVVAHLILVGWALSQPQTDTMTSRDTLASDRMVRPTWVFPEKEKALPETPKEVEVEAPKEETQPQLAAAEPPAPEEPKPKKTFTKPKRKKKAPIAKKAPKKKAAAIIASTSESAPAAEAVSLDQAVEVGAEATTAPEAAVVVADSESASDVVAAPKADPVADLDGLRLAYIGKLNARFQKERVYPRAAKRAGIQGEVLLEIVIGADGSIKDARILKSSGHSILDAAAVAAVSEVDDLPAPPSMLGWESRSMRVPFVYRLS